MLRKENYKDLDKWRDTKNKQKKRYYKKTQNGCNSGKPWLKQELKLIMEHKKTDTELAIELGRSVAAIQRKRCKVKKENIKPD